MLKEGDINLEYYKEQMEALSCEDYELRGGSGYCFIDGDEVVKIYFRAKLKEYMNDMSKYSSEKIAFPKWYIMKYQKYQGEIMTYFPYAMFYYALEQKNCSLERLQLHYDEMVNVIKGFPNIHMTDLDFFGNVLYDENKGFYLIDTSDWKDEEWSHAERGNISRFNKALFDAMKLFLFEDIDDRVFKNEINYQYQGIKGTNAGKELLETMSTSLMGIYDFMAFVNAYQEVVKSCFGATVTRAEDMKKYIKKMKNS